jgi:hypothetical protein
MNRRIIQRSVIALVLISSLFIGIFGCSSGTPSAPSQTPNANDITGLQPGDIVVTSSVSEGHTHQVTIKYYDIESPPISDKFTTTEAGVGPHTHTVTLTKPDFEAIAAGKTVKVTSSVSMEYNHTHTFTIKK